MNTMSAAVTEFASPLIMVRLDLDLVPNDCCDTHSASSAQPEMRVEKTNAGYISCICQVTESLSFSVPFEFIAAGLVNRQKETCTFNSRYEKPEL